MKLETKLKYLTKTFIITLPLLFYLIRNINGTIALIEIFENGYFEILSNNIIYETIMAVFGINGIIPLISEPFAYYITYIFTIYLLDILLDLLLFLPKCVDYFTDKLTWKEKE